ncbi:hypothetical protein AOL_s00097g489 [Orbilia oligospora ATCC 24927]|uniref:NIPA-like protein 3 n=1 Tax=Arthrobotrys oligospora (strain ATCC 24927 / CBS 115.81 / DSM 1491) TaxID=756982 RepID=G1XJG2_ARTOA|nr:hypothetical protein AOL_s00097g489 [Orbilia oligospora ATCC 24927]EGX46741.1 hypothetical protein AOL_s00097g489 [Orbilia oligospora ATCC 24927]
MVDRHNNKYECLYTNNDFEGANSTICDVIVGIGEVANFAAYAFAPAILVTPLGALSVLIGAVLSSYFLHEDLGLLGKLGCAICLIGSVIIVLHAPADEEVDEIELLLHYAIQPGFLFYCFFVSIFAFVMIYKISPKYGKKNPLIYLSVCSTVGSVSVMSVKAFGIALKLTLGGNNQFSHPSTYVFIIVTAVCILTQMNYFNKALSQFSSSIVNPLYYVTFTTATLTASFILFKGFNTSSAVNVISLLCGFLIIFAGVYLLNLARINSKGLMNGHADVDSIPTDPISGFQTRRSMQARRSLDPNRLSGSSFRRTSRDEMMYEETMVGLTDLAEDSDDGDEERGMISPRKSSGMPRSPGLRR